jgi:N-acetylglucosamine malate deacetylase 1
MIRTITRSIPITCILFSILACTVAIAQTPPGDGKLRIIVFGAHPDDNEFRNGGVAAMWAAQGHHVKFVSTTNGDIGHYEIAGGPLARLRLKEIQDCAKILGIDEATSLDIHDGEIMPTLENRKIFARLIRDWQADIVISHRPYDYHPDHRYTGVLVQDASFMVRVPFFTPDTPPTPNNPVFLYNSDRFQKPYPFQADIAVSIDAVFDQKMDALMAIPSQSLYLGAVGSAERTAQFPKDEAGKRAFLVQRFGSRHAQESDRFRDVLIQYYGEAKGRAVQYAETFEICEYGRQPTDEEIRQLFPFFPKP